MNIKNEIITILKEIEKEKNVKIIYACDIGSHTSGYAVKNSDYDIRFIYIQDTRKYLSLSEPKEVIEREIVKSNQKYDIVGFDIKKTLSHIAKSNMQIWTWLYSPSVFITSDIAEQIKNILTFYENKKKILFQYSAWFKSYVKRNESDKIKVKYYLNILIRLNECFNYINGKFTFQTVDNVNYSESINKTFLSLLNKRQNNIEIIERIPELDTFIEERIEYLFEISIKAEAKTVDYSKINDLFYSIVKENNEKN